MGRQRRRELLWKEHTMSVSSRFINSIGAIFAVQMLQRYCLTIKFCSALTIPATCPFFSIRHHKKMCLHSSTPIPVLSDSIREDVAVTQSFKKEKMVETSSKNESRNSSYDADQITVLDGQIIRQLKTWKEKHFLKVVVISLSVSW